MRRRMLKWIAGSFALGGAYALGQTWLAPSRLDAADVPNLQETLEKGLYARLPEHFDFIERIVLLVQLDRISLKLVYSTFQWALRFEKGRRFYYFEAAMKKRAGDLGVAL
ncbi:hypothetical protein C5Y96_06785 [Blastopirellula marina]|uniref:Uncharacterized protein n=2 Tax=Pirellulales TaxID=2691354 RepID=A0A2S8FXG6_9BACT|nr:hypothetical protein C5Y96_06785 [Blastopirellula marina]RCS53580.1 hypothetical protein DTL36_06795 [Bremerella cremea]